MDLKLSVKFKNVAKLCLPLGIHLFPENTLQETDENIVCITVHTILNCVHYYVSNACDPVQVEAAYITSALSTQWSIIL